MPSAPVSIFGYSDRWSVRPGQLISFHVSTEGVQSYRSTLVKLRHGYTGAAGPGFLETEIPSSIDGVRAGAAHACAAGSFVQINDAGRKLAAPADVIFEAFVFPTLPQGSRSGKFGAYGVGPNSPGSIIAWQTVFGTWSEGSQTGYALLLDRGHPAFIWSDGGGARKVLLPTPLQSHQWYRLRVVVDGRAGRLTLEQSPVTNIMNRQSSAASAPTAEQASAETGGWLASDAPFRIGALARREGDRWLAQHVYNGKIAGVGVKPISCAPPLAEWHFGYSGREDGLLLDLIFDLSSSGLHGTCFNAPMRAATGHRFTGIEEDFRTAPDAFDAIHFHDDDVGDTQWPAAFEFRVPEDFASGVYAIRLAGDGAEFYIPFFIGPGRLKSKVAVLFSTATYLAYANDHIAFEASGAELIGGHPLILDALDLALQDHPEFGRSCYDTHNDGSAVVFSSVRRPILNCQPRHRGWFQAEGLWSLPADLCIVHWLETLQCPFDAITDEDLDREGVELLRDYAVLVTGSHPEYVTRNEIAAIESFTSNGGRLMCLGGNAFFATVSFDPENRQLMELRRSDGGTRPHQSAFGDRRHATSGEVAGLWRNKGLPPQRLIGVGFASQGFDRSTYYERLQDSFHPLAQFVFEGIGAEERLGDFGIMGGGAAGAEVDRYDPDLGSPQGALLLATSAPLSDAYLLVAEEAYESIPGIGGTEQAGVRADIVLCPLPNGGGVFSVGSIAYSAALSHNNYNNNIGRMTTNVLLRFLEPVPLDVTIR